MLKQRSGSDAIYSGTTCGLVRVGRWSRDIRKTPGRAAQHLEIAMDACRTPWQAPVPKGACGLSLFESQGQLGPT